MIPITLLASVLEDTSGTDKIGDASRNKNLHLNALGNENSHRKTASSDP